MIKTCQTIIYDMWIMVIPPTSQKPYTIHCNALSGSVIISLYFCTTSNFDHGTLGDVPSNPAGTQIEDRIPEDT